MAGTLRSLNFMAHRTLDLERLTASTMPPSVPPVSAALSRAPARLSASVPA